MVSKNDQPMPDIAFHLDQLGETTTAADLVRKKGQSRKLKVISEKKLTGWIMALLEQHMAGKEGAFSDREKEELLERAQAELANRIEREKTLEAERAKAQARVDEVMATLDKQKLSKGELDEALAMLREQLEAKEKHEQQLQQSNDELSDEIEKHRALVAATIKEKDKLHIELQGVKERDTTFRGQAVRSADLCGSILGIDRDYYGEKHQDSLPVPADASQEQAFFHDFEVSAKVVETLSRDLERLRAIAQSAEADRAKRDEEKANLLESDLQLLEQLKAGSLAATDVAQPVAALVEALGGARAEAEALEEHATEHLGIAGAKQAEFTSVPEEGGKPAEVLAGATQVVRELAAALAKERQRLGAVKAMADEADEARGEREAELEKVREANTRLMDAIATQARAQGVAMGPAVTNANADVADRETAAAEVVKNLRGKDPKAEAEAARLAGDLDRARTEGAALRKQVDELQAQLKSKRDSEGRLAAGLKELGQTVFAAETAKQQPGTASFTAGASRVQELDAALSKPASEQQQGDVLGAAYAVVDALKRDVAKREEKNKSLVGDLDMQRRSNDELKRRVAQLEKEHDELKARAHAQAKAEQAIAESVVEGAQDDPELADAAADLAVAMESKDAAGAQERSTRAAATVAQLVKRKQALQRQVELLSRDLGKTRTEAEARTKATEKDLEAARARLVELEKQGQATRAQREQLEARVAELEGERDEALASGKEVIQQLNQSRDRAVGELNELKGREAAAQKRADELARRVQTAEAANRALVDALGDLQRVGGDSGVRAALDEAMTELPGDDDVPLNPEAAKKIAAAGKAVIADVTERANRLAGATERLTANDARLRKVESELDEERAALAQARDHIREVEHEQAEMAASGKEVITQLTQARDARAAEAASLKREADQLSARVDSLNHRVVGAEAANRALAEALSKVAAAEAGAREVDERRVDLETCLSELPEEGEENIVVSPDLAPRLAEAGKKVVEAIAARTKAHKEQAAKAERAAHENAARGEKLEKDLAAAKAEVAAAKAAVQDRQRQLDTAKGEVTQLTRRTEDAEAAARDIASALQKVAGPEQGKAAAAIAQALEAHANGKPIPHHTLAKAGAEVAESLARSREDAKRLAGELDRARAETDAAKKAGDEARKRVAEVAQQLAQAQGEERRLSDAAANLSKELLATAKAAVADLDPKRAEAIGKSMASLDQANGQQRLAAGIEVIGTLRDRLNRQQIDLAETRAKSQAEGQRLGEELDQLKRLLNARTSDLAATEKTLAAAARERDDAAKKLAALGQEHERVSAALKSAQEEMRLIKADLEGYQAVEGATNMHAAGEVDKLRKELSSERAFHEQADLEIASLTEKADALEARMRKQREELHGTIEQLRKDVAAKQKTIDGITGQKIDVEALQAETEQLRKELTDVRGRLKEFESLHGQTAGAASKSTGLAKQLAEVQKSRDELNERNLMLESKVADLVGQVEEQRVGRDKQTKDLQARLEKAKREIEGFAKQFQDAENETQKLKAELAGAKAKMRKLTEG